MVREEDLAWEADPTALADFDKVCRGEARKMTATAKRQLCGYFNHDERCLKKALNTSALKPPDGVKGAKLLKTRLALPGCGKSGGLRLEYLVWCEEKRVKLSSATLRRDA